MTTDNNTLHIYTRVSTSTQEEKGTSLESQEKLGIEKAEELGFKHKVWNEGGASSNFETLENRPVLLELLEKINRDEVKHLWVYNNDRLSRNEITALEIRIAMQKHGVKLYTKDGVFDLNIPQDKFVKGILDSLSQYDNALRSERTRMGKLTRVKQGFWQGGPTPFGYHTVDKKLVPHPIESEWVKKIFQWYADRKSIDEIKREMDKSGIKPRRGNPIWSNGSINKLLQNTHHKGEYTFTDKSTGEVVECKCPPIVSKTLWNRCQDNRKKILQRKGQNMKTTHFYMLRDLMYCGHCGHHITGRKKPSKNENFYYCPKKERDWKNSPLAEEEKWKRGRGCSMTRSLNIDATDELVWNTVKYAVTKAMFEDVPDFNEMLQSIKEKEQKSEAEVRETNRKIERYRRELRQIRNQIADVETQILLGKKAGDIGSRIVENLEEEHNRVQGEIEQLEMSSQMTENVLDRMVNADKFSKKFL